MSRCTADRFGKMPTTSVMRRISLFSRSWGLFDHTLLPVSAWEADERQNVGSGFCEHRGCVREPVTELIDDSLHLHVHLLGRW